MVDKYAHVAGCNCPSCSQIRRNRQATGDQNWDHSPDCGCGRCRQIENLRMQAEIKDRITQNKQKR